MRGKGRNFTLVTCVNLLEIQIVGTVPKQHMQDQRIDVDDGNHIALGENQHQRSPSAFKLSRRPTEEEQRGLSEGPGTSDMRCYNHKVNSPGCQNQHRTMEHTIISSGDIIDRGIGAHVNKRSGADALCRMQNFACIRYIALACLVDLRIPSALRDI